MSFPFSPFFLQLRCQGKLLISCKMWGGTVIEKIENKAKVSLKFASFWSILSSRWTVSPTSVPSLSYAKAASHLNVLTWERIVCLSQYRRDCMSFSQELSHWLVFFDSPDNRKAKNWKKEKYVCTVLKSWPTATLNQVPKCAWESAASTAWIQVKGIPQGQQTVRSSAHQWTAWRTHAQK